jgi:hypothetical protein
MGCDLAGTTHEGFVAKETMVDGYHAAATPTKLVLNRHGLSSLRDPRVDQLWGSGVIGPTCISFSFS